GYVQINGSDLSQDLINLANTIASSYAGDPVMLRSSQTFNGRNGDVIQARKKYDGCVRELDVLRLRAREQDYFHSQNLFDWILHLIEHHISNLPYATQRLKNEYDLYANENLQILSNYYADSPILRRLAELAFDSLLLPNDSKLSNG
ncbi:30825_t:CDS:2, partial [Racocetra persica]